jgi:hypothetical protein
LVEAGLLQRRRYSEHPPRDEYLPTERGRDFRPVLIALLAWGNKHFAPEGASVHIVDSATGAPVDPIMVDAATRRTIAAPDYVFAAGPAAPDRIRRRYARHQQPAEASIAAGKPVRASRKGRAG